MMWILVVVAILATYLGVTLVNAQVLGTSRSLAWGESQRDGDRELPASRGAIYDRNGQALALSVAQPRAIADPANIKHPGATAKALAPILGVERVSLEKDLNSKTRYKVLSENLTDKQVAAIHAGVTEGTIEGITIEDKYVRSNPNGDLALGVIGRSLADGQTDEAGNEGGISGLEKSFDKYLTGTAGKYFYEQDVWGNPIAGGSRSTIPAVQGADLFLTLDEALQYEAERSISDAVASSGADSAQAVIMVPSTGEILAMASVTADEDGKVHVSRDNKPVTAVFEPGSVNKMITIAGAMEEGVVSPETVLDVPDHLQIYDAEFHDSHPHPAAAWSTTEILYTSSNIGTIKIAQRLGSEKVDKYLRDFGFGATTGLGFPAEEDGIMKDLEDWSGVDIGTMPIGQGISVTALQMLSAYNVIANDGVYVAPKLVGSIDKGDGPVPTQPANGRRVVSADTAAKMRAMLAKVVSEGTGTKAQVPGYVPAGKTGTARIAQGGTEGDGYLDENGNYRYDASFVGMIDGADLSILVTVRDPKTSIFGGDVAAPVFSHLAATALRRYQIPPPQMLKAASQDVPELSASARKVEGEEVAAGSASGQG